MTDAQLLEAIGRALYGERWQAPLARDLSVHKDTMQDWKQGRTSPREGVYADLQQILNRRAVELDRAAAALQRRLAGAANRPG